MATPTNFRENPAASVGCTVYKHCRPQKPGVVLKYLGKRRIYPDRAASEQDRFLILWIDGTETDEGEMSLKSFDELISDHEKKLATHRASLKKLRKLEQDRK